MTYFGTSPDYDRMLDHQMEAQSVENDSFFAFCEERGYNEDADDAMDAWEAFKRADMESQLRDEDLLAERFQMELRDGE